VGVHDQPRRLYEREGQDKGARPVVLAHVPAGAVEMEDPARLTWHPDPGYANMAPMSSEETWKQLRDRTRITRVSLSALRSQPEPGSADVGLVADDLEKVIAAIDCVLAGGSSDGGGPVTAP